MTIIKKKKKKIPRELVLDTCFIEALSIERSRDSDNVAERKTVSQIAKYS